MTAAALLLAAATAAAALAAAAEPAAAPAESAEPASSCTTWYDSTQHGDSFVSAADFGAKPDGKTDSTAAIQAAVDSGRGSVGAKRRATVYLPSGEYRPHTINPLLLVLSRSFSDRVCMGTVVSDTMVLWAATTFVGSSSAAPGCRSILRLKDSSAGFGDTSALKPVLVTSESAPKQPTRCL